MEFNNNSNNQDIVSGIRDMTSTNSSSYPINEITRRVNRWLYRVYDSIEKSTPSGWMFDDSTKTDLPIFLRDLSDGVEDYELPESLDASPQGGTTKGELMYLKRLEIKDDSGTWYKLEPMTLNDIEVALPEYESTSGIPGEYFPMGNSVILKPAPASGDVTLTQGMRMTGTRELVAFTPSDTTKEPGFPEVFHEILVLGPAWDFIRKNGTDTQAQNIKDDLDTMFSNLREWYADRYEDLGQPTIEPASAANQHQYE